jgi:hypothetical protein
MKFYHLTHKEMKMMLNEDQIEQMTLDIFRELGWEVKHGGEISRDADPYAPLPRLSD